MGYIADILKYEGDNTTFVWKHPCEDFNSYTQLIVHETQEAVLFLNGQALDSFGPGRHTLETQNTPLLSGLLNRTTNGETPFHCEVYFINKTEQMAIRWGTDSQAQFLEPTYHFPLSLGASGEMSLRVLDARRLLLRLVGTAPVLDQQTLAAYFRAFLMARVKTYIAQFMQANTVSIFELDAHMLDFSQALQQQLAPDFADYGVELVRFFVTNLARPDGDAQYEKFKELHFRKYADIAEAQLRQQTDLIQAQTEAQKTLIASQAIAQKRVQEGYTYQQERSFDVAQDAAKNAGAGGLTGLGIGIGAMAGVGGSVGGLVGNTVSDALRGTVQPPETDVFCDNCGARLPQGATFCDNCGHAVPHDKNICAKCGYRFTRDGKFCPKCGAERED